MKAILALKVWILLNLRKKCLKFGENRGNIQKIYDSVRKELQDKCHCAWPLLKVTWTCPIWQSEKMVEKLNRSSCLVKFSGRFGIIAQAGRVEFTAAKSEGMKPIILVSCLVHSSKVKSGLVNGHFLNIWQPKHGSRFILLFIFLKNRMWFCEFYCSD